MYLLFCLNLSNNYNHKMNDNYIIDQLCLVYQLLRFKWWLSLMIWVVDNSLINSYLLFKSYHE